MKWLRRLDALVNHVHVAGVNSAIPEQAEAWELQELQRKLTGGASGYRPASVTPWIWDTDQTVEGVRWSYSHTRELTLTANVARGGSVSPLPLAVHQLELDKVRFRSPTRDVYAEKTPTTAVREVQVPYTVDSMLAATHADAFLVLHRGAIVAERYLHGTTARTKRLGMSMTKSYTSMLIGLLVQRGDLRLSDLLTMHVPELNESGYAGATVQNALDMCVSVEYDEAAVYSGKGFLDTKVYNHTVAWGGFPETRAFRQQGWERTNHSFVCAQPPAPSRKHGQFEYQSCVTEALGLLLERVGGQRYHTLLSELIWQPLGCEEDADLQLDRVGAPVACGGLCAVLRDWGRFGLCLARDGRVDLTDSGDQLQVLSRDYVVNSRRSSDALKEAYKGQSEGWTSSYHNQFVRFESMPLSSLNWLLGNDKEICCMIGVNGQFVLVDPCHDIVIVKLSSYPNYTDEWADEMFWRASEAIVRSLCGEHEFSMRADEIH